MDKNNHVSNRKQSSRARYILFEIAERKRLHRIMEHLLTRLSRSNGSRTTTRTINNAWNRKRRNIEFRRSTCIHGVAEFTRWELRVARWRRWRRRRRWWRLCGWWRRWCRWRAISTTSQITIMSVDSWWCREGGQRDASEDELHDRESFDVHNFWIVKFMWHHFDRCWLNGEAGDLVKQKSYQYGKSNRYLVDSAFRKCWKPRERLNL